MTVTDKKTDFKKVGVLFSISMNGLILIHTKSLLSAYRMLNLHRSIAGSNKIQSYSQVTRHLNKHGYFEHKDHLNFTFRINKIDFYK